MKRWRCEAINCEREAEWQSLMPDYVFTCPDHKPHGLGAWVSLRSDTP